MILIVCIETNYGMLFNKRRISQDSILNKRILMQYSDHTIWMNDYTASMFYPTPKNVKVDHDFLKKMLPNDVCIVENIPISQSLAEEFDQLIIYNWNRHYPSDLKLSISFTPWNLKSVEDFIGSSHEKITEERYEKI